MPTPQQEHVRLVRATVGWMQQNNANRIRADHLANFPQPDHIGSIPDVTAYFGTQIVVVEAETSVMLGEQHTADQWSAFYRYASRMNGHFIGVVVPADKSEAERLLRRLCGNAENVHIWTF